MTSMRPPLRHWQINALDAYRNHPGRDFLAVACTGAGKTTFALEAARSALAERIVDRVVVVTPTNHLRTQWANAAKELGLLLDHRLDNNSILGARYDGYVTTYGQVATKPQIHERRATVTRTLVLLDEIHHAGDGLAWGDALRTAFTPALRRLALSGTPFRTSPTEPIPFVTYTPDDDGHLRSAPDYIYSYADGLRDNVVRSAIFAAYSGTSQWINRLGEHLAATINTHHTSDQRAAWRTALDPSGDWVKDVLTEVHRHMTMLRAVDPTAGCLILASDQDTARAYQRIMRTISGTNPVLAISDDPDASKKIKHFTTSADPYLVSVRVVSEGVDIPRLRTLAYLSNATTAMFFTQAVGRIVRSGGKKQTATVFLPAVPSLMALAAELEQQRDHVLGAPNPTEPLEFDLDERCEPSATLTPVNAQAEFAGVLHSGQSGAFFEQMLDEEDADYLGLPGLLSAEQAATVLRARSTTTPEPAPDVEPAPPPVPQESPADVRSDIGALVGKMVAFGAGDHKTVHAQLRAAVPGPNAKDAPLEILQARRDWLLARTAFLKKKNAMF